MSEEPRKRRVFVSIEIPEELRKEKNWHITVAFCGYLDSAKLEKLTETAEKIAGETKSFELIPDKIINKNNRMIWLTFKYSPDFVRLAKKFSEFNESNFNPIPHTTLRRLKNDEIPNFDYLLPAKPFMVQSIDIMESHLASTGAKYELICRNYLK
jgi:2'-5' RNA ligase